MRLKELRTQRKMNMRQTALALGIPYTTYISYEKGDREPNSEMLINLADFFNCSVDYLIGRSDCRVDEKVLDKVNCIDNNLLEKYGNIYDAQQAQSLQDLKKGETVGCPLDDLVDSPKVLESEGQITAEERQHIKKYRTLDEYGKELIDTALDIEYNRCTADSKPETIKVFTAARSLDGQTPMGYEKMTKEEYEELINAPETDDDF